jgi:hypothetical protein
MKITKLLFVLATAVSVSSCSYSFSQKSRTTKSMDIAGSEIHQHPMIADLIVQDSKVVGTSTGLRDVSVESVNQDAIADALKKTGADVLVEPRFETEITSSRIVSSVIGYPATYKNFRLATKSDILLLRNSDSINRAIVNTNNNMFKTAEAAPQKKKGKGALVGGSIGLLGLLLLLLIL